jgi:hypothetical protein
MNQFVCNRIICDGVKGVFRSQASRLSNGIYNFVFWFMQNRCE